LKIHERLAQPTLSYNESDANNEPNYDGEGGDPCQTVLGELLDAKDD
jgi:hypothetical protein